MKISEQIAQTYQPIDLTATHQVDDGGRACTKSSKNAIIIIFTMLQDEKAECLVARQDAVHHRDSTVKELVIACERFGLVQDVHFKVTHAPMELRFLWSKQVIKFGAMNDIEKLKGFKPSSSSKYFSLLWFFEVSEFKDSYDIEQVISTFIRGGNKTYFNCLYETNPPASMTHWYYEWREKIQQLDDYAYRFRTYLDLTDWEKEHWLGKPLLKQIKNLQRLDIEQYNHIYLGMTRKLKGAIYKRFGSSNIKEIEYSITREYYIGVDYGEADATSATLIGIDGAKSMHAYAQYHHRNESDEKDINDYASDVHDFIMESYLKTKKKIIVLVDSANLSFYKLLKAKENHAYEVRKVKKEEIQTRIDQLNICINADVFSIDPLCKNIIGELSTAVYNDKGVRTDTKTNTVDGLDSLEYAFSIRMKLIVEYLMKG